MFLLSIGRKNFSLVKFYFVISILLFLFSFPSLANTKEIQDKLKQSFSGENESNSNDKFALSIDGHRMSFHIFEKKQHDSSLLTAISLAPPNVDVKDPMNLRNTCLFLEIRKDKTAYLAWISTKDETGKDRECGLPSLAKPGEYLLRLVDRIAQTLVLSSTGLIDIATIRCPKNGQNIDLRMLNLVRGIKGWYEKNGYDPEDTTTYNKAYISLREYSVSEMVNIIKNVTDSDIKAQIANLESHMSGAFRSYKQVLNELVEYWKDFSKNRDLFFKHIEGENLELTFGEFASSLYAKGCEKYSEVMNILMPELVIFQLPVFKKIKPFDVFPWLDNYAAFKSTFHLVKKYYY